MSGPERSGAFEIDVRRMSAEERRDALAEALDLLRTGHTVFLVTDRDPKPLLGAFEEAHKGEFHCVVSATTPGCYRAEMRVARAAPAGIVATALAADHARLESQLVELGALLQAGSFEAAAGLCARFGAALVRHMGAEEELLLPALRHMTNAAAQPVDRMLLEHDALRTLVQQLSRSIQDRDGKWAARWQETQRLLGQHQHEEEQTVHPISDWALAADEQDELVYRLRGE